MRCSQQSSGFIQKSLLYLLLLIAALTSVGPADGGIKTLHLPAGVGWWL
jgi:hypothetical protein